MKLLSCVLQPIFHTKAQVFFLADKMDKYDKIKFILEKGTKFGIYNFNIQLVI